YFNAAIEIDPAYAKAYYNRGYCNELMGNFAQARKDYQRTMDIIPNYEKAIEGLNRLDRKQGIGN
ncbi:MAG: tetratricopeptide repeat protein, partial [Bacteroidales bacterium]|nr:tetratricopeptide repeat protein [Bacteroidales bacterium]